MLPFRCFVRGAGRVRKDSAPSLPRSSSGAQRASECGIAGSSARRSTRRGTRRNVRRGRSWIRMQLREWGVEQRGARASEHAKMEPMCHMSASYRGVWGSVADWRRRARGKNKALAKRSINHNVQCASTLRVAVPPARQRHRGCSSTVTFAAAACSSSAQRCKLRAVCTVTALRQGCACMRAWMACRPQQAHRRCRRRVGVKHQL